MRNIFNYGLADKTASYSVNQLQLRDYLANRRTLGFNMGMDYEIDSRNKLYIRGLYSQYKDGQSVRETYFNFDNKNVTLQARHTDYLTDLYSMELGRESSGWSAYGNYPGRYQKHVQSSDSTHRIISEKSERGYPIVNFIQPMTYGNLSADGRKYMAMDAPDGIGDTGDYTLPHQQKPIAADQLKVKSGNS